MSNLEDCDRDWVVRRLPPAVKSALKAHGPQLFLAGGFIRAVIAGEKVSDVDLFVPSKEYGATVINNFAAGEDPKPAVHESENAYTVKVRGSVLQVIHRWTYQAPEDCLASFDFTIAQAAVWWSGEVWRSACSSRFYCDLAGRRLIYTRPQRNEDAGGSMLRVLKFYQRGYRIPLDSLGAVIARLCTGVRDEGWSDETKAAQVITALLVEVDPITVEALSPHLPSEAEEARQEIEPSANDAVHEEEPTAIPQAAAVLESQYCDCVACPVCKRDRMVCAKCGRCTNCSGHEPGCIGCALQEIH